jgi:hypothetical protein
VGHERYGFIVLRCVHVDGNSPEFLNKLPHSRSPGFLTLANNPRPPGKEITSGGYRATSFTTRHGMGANKPSSVAGDIGIDLLFDTRHIDDGGLRKRPQGFVHDGAHNIGWRRYDNKARHRRGVFSGVTSTVVPGEVNSGGGRVFQRYRYPSLGQRQTDTGTE